MKKALPPVGRPSIPPEMLLRALLLQAFYGVRSERQLMERLDFDLLFRWFVELGIDDPVWNTSTFSKNRDRLRATRRRPSSPPSSRIRRCGGWHRRTISPSTAR